MGDTLIVDGYLARSGGKIIDARRVTLPNGRVVSGGTPGDGGPDAESRSRLRKRRVEPFSSSSTIRASPRGFANRTNPVPDSADLSHSRHGRVGGFAIAIVDLRILNVAFRREPPRGRRRVAAADHVG